MNSEKKDHKDFKKSTKHNNSEDDEENPKPSTISLSNVSSKTNELMKMRLFQVILVLILIAIPVFFAIDLRAGTHNSNFVNGVYLKNLKATYLNQIKSKLLQQNPYLAASSTGQAKLNSQAQQLFNQQFPIYYTQNKAQIEQQISMIKQNFRNPNGVPFLMAIDPYYWLREARNILDHGNTWDAYINGSYYDTYILAGTPIKYLPARKHIFNNIMPVMEVGVYKLLNLFGANVELMYAAFITPIIIMVLATIIAFFIGRRISGMIGGFFTALIIAIHPFILTRTIGGFADTDGFNILFPLLIAWLLIESFESKKFGIKSVIYSALAGLSVFLFSIAWSGWNDFFDLFLFVLIIVFAVRLAFVMLYRVASKKKKIFTKEKTRAILDLSVIVIFFVSSFIFLSLYENPGYFFSNISTGPSSASHLKSVGYTNFWPNVMTTVAELNTGTWSNIFSYNGGSALFLIILFAMIALPILNYFSKTKKDYLIYVVLIYAWFFATIYASLISVRFILLLAPAFALAFGAVVGWGSEFLRKIFRNQLDLPAKIGTIIIVVVFLLIIFMPGSIYSQATTVSNNYSPNMDLTWYNVLTDIKVNTSSNSIVNSWWDFGHEFKYFANRRVTLDGSVQNSPQAYWLGRALGTSNELESAEILRMLDCGGNYAFNTLDNYTKTVASNNAGYKTADDYFNSPNISQDSLIIAQERTFNKAMNMLNAIIPMNHSAAAAYLKSQNVPNDVSNTVLSYSKCKAPEDIFITSSDMVGKAPVWAHLGVEWNFSKAMMWYLGQRVSHNTFDSLLSSDFNLTNSKKNDLKREINDLKHSSDPNNNANSWISPWPSYVTGTNLVTLTVKNDTLVANNINAFIGKQGSAAGNVNVVIGSVVINKSDLKDINTTAYAVTSNGNSIVGKMGIRFSKLIVAENSTYTVYPLNKTGAQNIDILIYHPEADKYYMLLAQPPLADSVFTKLFFLDGYGMKYFNNFDEQRDVFGTKIIAWKLNWPYNNN